MEDLDQVGPSLDQPQGVVEPAPQAPAVQRLAGLRRVARPIVSFFRDPGQVLATLLLLALISRAIWLWLPQGSLIFDEAYYVNASRVMLGWEVPKGANYAGSPPGIDPNSEHPPLAKVAIAASMKVFGDNGVGWRLPSLIAGMVALVALYGIIRAAGETAWLAVLGVGLFAFDNLALVHSRIGTLDMLFVAPALVGAWLALRDRFVWAGVAFAIAALMKETAIFGLAAVVLFQVVELSMDWWRSRRIRIADLRPAALMLSAWAIVAIGGLWLLDLQFSSYHNPWDHLQHILAFGGSLQATGGQTGIASNPWQWMVNEQQINYLRVAVDVSSNGKVIASNPTVDFRGALNPILIGAAPIALLFTLWLAWRSRSRLALWTVAWTITNYLPYFWLVLVNHRITYLYYFLPTVPAIAIAVALLLVRSGLPRIVNWGYLVGIGWGFLAYFPFRQIP